MSIPIFGLSDIPSFDPAFGSDPVSNLDPVCGGSGSQPLGSVVGVSGVQNDLGFRKRMIQSKERSSGFGGVSDFHSAAGTELLPVDVARRAMSLPISMFLDASDPGESYLRLSRAWFSSGSAFHASVAGTSPVVDTFAAVLGFLIEECEFAQHSGWELALVSSASSSMMLNLPSLMVNVSAGWSSRQILSQSWRYTIDSKVKRSHDIFVSEVTLVRREARLCMYDGYDPKSMYEPLLRGFVEFARSRLWLVP